MSTLSERLADRVSDPRALLSFESPSDAPPVELSYGQAVAWGERIAGLVDAPIEAGARVLLILPQGPALHGAFFGALWHGLVPSVLAYPTFKMSPALYHAQIDALCRHLSPARIVTDEKVAALLGGLPVHAVRDPAAPSAAPEARPRGVRVRPAPGDVAFLQHSAGTTGLQKGVALSHGAVLEHVLDYAKALAVTDDDRVASWLPLYHDMGLVACLVLPMVCGIPCATMSPVEWVMRPTSILRVMHARRSTLAWWPNFTFAFLAKRATDPDMAHRLDAVRALVNCSEPVTAAAFAAFLERFGPAGARPDQMHASYAMAENTFAVTQTTAGPPRTLLVDREVFERDAKAALAAPGRRTTAWTSSGRLFGSNELRVVDEGREVDPGRVGELWIKSRSMLSGYWGRPDLTATAISDGWYRTGDLGFVHEQELYVTGRKRDLVIVGGKNLYPQDIEDVAASDPDVHDGRAVAIGVRDEVAGTEDLLVAVETHDAEAACGDRAASIAARVRKAVAAAFEVAPRRVFVVPPMWLLKSSAGKISRSRNRDKLVALLTEEES